MSETGKKKKKQQHQQQRMRSPRKLVRKLIEGMLLNKGK